MNLPFPEGNKRWLSPINSRKLTVCLMVICARLDSSQLCDGNGNPVRIF